MTRIGLIVVGAFALGSVVLTVDMAGMDPDMAQPPPPPPPPADMALNCDPAVATTDSGHHNPGADCATCHTGGAATAWPVSGTLYNAVNGTTAIAGVTIHVTDAKGQKLSLVSALNGNFDTATPVTYPITGQRVRLPLQRRHGRQRAGAGELQQLPKSTFRVHLP